MRRIDSKFDERKAGRRNAVIIGIVMIALLALSPIAFSLFSGDRNDASSNEKEGFVYQNGLWKIVLSEQVFGFQNLPSEVANVSVEGDFDLNDYNGQVVYFSEMNSGANEILQNVGRFVLRVQEACVDEDCEGDFPVKDCSNNFIIFEEGDEDMVYKNDSCVFIVGDAVRGADAFLYEVLMEGN